MAIYFIYCYDLVMEVEEMNLYELYVECFETKPFQPVKEMKKGEKRIFITLIISSIIYLITAFGFLFRVTFFAIPCLISGVVSVINASILLVYVAVFRKKTKKYLGKEGLIIFSKFLSPFFYLL